MAKKDETAPQELTTNAGKELTTAELLAQIEALKSENQTLKKKNNAGFPDEEINAKIEAGLTREQAISVLQQQRASEEKAAKDAEKAKSGQAK